MIITASVMLLLSCCSGGEKKPAAAEAEAKAKCCGGGGGESGCKHHHSKDSLVFSNEAFYTDGKFNVEAGKDAILRLMKYYNYPVTERTREQLWVSDYGTGRFTELGLAAIMYVNNETDRYMLQDLFMLPNQMLPEHWHEKPSGELPAKMEGWLVRNGLSYIVGEGEDNISQFPAVKVPACHTGGVTVKNVVKTLPGEFVPLGRMYAHHWQFAGPEGAIVTEVANVHSNEAVRHQVPSINNFFLGK